MRIKCIFSVRPQEKTSALNSQSLPVSGEAAAQNRFAIFMGCRAPHVPKSLGDFGAQPPPHLHILLIFIHTRA